MRKTKAWKGESTLINITWLGIAEPVWNSCILGSLQQMVPPPPSGLGAEKLNLEDVSRP